jgi:Domain of unknown function (DUF4333)
MAKSVAWMLGIPTTLTGLIIGTVACSSGEKSVSKNDVASQITQKMTDAAGNKPDSVTCPDDLKAKVGATLNCQMKVKDQTYGVNVTVTSVQGDQAKFDMVKVYDKNQVATILTDNLTQQVGHKPDSVTCPDGLKATDGATLRCQLTDAGQTYGVTVSVSGQGGDATLNYKVDEQPT